MWSVSVGDLVVYIGKPPDILENPDARVPLTEGTIYTVLHIRDDLQYPGVYLMVSGHPDLFFNAVCFRPVTKPSIESLKSLLTPIPKGLFNPKSPEYVPELHDA